MASLRAVQRSGRWVAFWQTHPDRYRPPTEDASPSTPPMAAAAAPRPTVTTTPPLSAAVPRVAASAAGPRIAPRPKPTPAQRPLLLPRSA